MIKYKQFHLHSGTKVPFPFPISLPSETSLCDHISACHALNMLGNQTNELTIITNGNWTLFHNWCALECIVQPDPNPTISSFLDSHFQVTTSIPGLIHSKSNNTASIIKLLFSPADINSFLQCPEKAPAFQPYFNSLHAFRLNHSLLSDQEQISQLRSYLPTAPLIRAATSNKFHARNAIVAFVRSPIVSALFTGLEIPTIYALSVTPDTIKAPKIANYSCRHKAVAMQLVDYKFVTTTLFQHFRSISLLPDDARSAHSPAFIHHFLKATNDEREKFFTDFCNHFRNAQGWNIFVLPQSETITILNISVSIPLLALDGHTITGTLLPVTHIKPSFNGIAWLKCIT